ncbi:hypothetical protein HYH03_018192 [Edaphochlamys debaryana]|uniref:OTU domain-containing protein n=1 Tax=Edaphochlamys debaryana TaxID=47281 RepID=A0A835XE93_9CHLO|nr:hypothetical protein HYH03_018192 [Edaphochlamys debaryana]|eukprot:KAG2482912.1 hypothetical protein HYH03_018192 [Edaphochlamys debaryana]
MGRRGMKGFLKGPKGHKADSSDDEAAAPAPAPAPEGGADAAPSTSKPAAAPQPAQAKAAEPKVAAGGGGGGSDSESGSDDEGGHKGPETRGHMLQRHKRELAAHKKTVQKLGSKKKDEAAKLTTEIEARHARELKELDEREKAAAAAPPAAAAAAAGSAAAAVAAEGAAEHLGELGLEGGDHKKSKAAKRREKLEREEAEREQRIAQEQAALGPSDKAVEEAALRELLRPHSLGIREIRADGHCLYRAVEDQLTQAAGGGASAPPPDYLALRRLAAAHIRAHADEFSPFIYDEDAGGSPGEQLDAYCEELESTAAWGGQLELGALAQALRRQVKVFTLGMPPVTLGDEHAAAGVLTLCYLRHAFGLGEHYNSVGPLGAEAEEA